MAGDGAQAGPIETLLAQTRAAREALHTLVTRLRDERPFWQRYALGLAQRERLTHAQRQLFREQRAARPAGAGHPTQRY
jgi:hypothetical protein